MPATPETSRVKVLVLVWAMRIGGSQSFVSTMLEHLDRQQFKPALATMVDPSSDYPLPTDVPIYVVASEAPLEPPVGLSLPSEAAADPASGADWVRATVSRIAALVTRLKPEVVLVTPEYPAVLAAAAASRFPATTSLVCRIPAYPSVAFPAEGGNPVYAALSRTCLRSADVLVANSPGLVRDLIAEFGADENRVRILRNPLDVERVRELSAEGVTEVPLDDGVPTLVFAGRLERIKGPEYLVRALAQLVPKQRARCVFLGEGSQAGYLRALVKHLGISDLVHFLGAQANPFRFMSKADLFVLPSLSEGMPNVLLEAMACGCPVVATDIEGGIVRDLLEDGAAGLIVPPADVDELAVAIERLLGDTGLREELVREGLRRARDFDIGKTVPCYEDLFLSLAAGERQERGADGGPDFVGSPPDSDATVSAPGPAMSIWRNSARAVRARSRAIAARVIRPFRDRLAVSRRSPEAEPPVGCEHEWLSDETPLVLCLAEGALAPVDLFLNALSIAREQEPIRGLVVTDRGYAEVGDLIAARGMSEAAACVCPLACVRSLLPACIAVFSAPDAGVPGFYRDAIDQGCVVLTPRTSTAAAAFLTAHTCGVVVPPHDAAALGEAMLQLVWDDDARRLLTSRASGGR